MTVALVSVWVGSDPSSATHYYYVYYVYDARDDVANLADAADAVVAIYRYGAGAS